ncbi:acetyl-CoA carboxylase biotin carboxyl carrier protein [Candidatus Hydrogenedentota bacterium]
METEDLRELIDLFESSKLSELELEKEGIRLKLKKEVSGQTISTVVPQHAIVQAPANPVEVPVAPVPAAGEDEDFPCVKSPMVGTFYAAPAPDAQPFIKIGDVVTTTQTVCVIEAMKVMNEVEAEMSGTVEAILVENGQPVEFGQPLFRIRPN